MLHAPKFAHRSANLTSDLGQALQHAERLGPVLGLAPYARAGDAHRTEAEAVVGVKQEMRAGRRIGLPEETRTERRVARNLV